MRVGVIGLGNMGMGVAISLRRAGHLVFGCDLNEAARTELAAAASGHASRDDAFAIRAWQALTWIPLPARN